MRLKNRQTTLSTTPPTASADITENKMVSITNASSLGIPSVCSAWEGRQGEKSGKGRGGERKKMQRRRIGQKTNGDKSEGERGRKRKRREVGEGENVSFIQHTKHRFISLSSHGTNLSSPGKISPVDTVNCTLLVVKLVSPMLTRASSPAGCTLYCCTVVRTFRG